MTLKPSGNGVPVNKDFLCEQLPSVWEADRVVVDITTKLYEEAMAGPVPSRPFGDDQTAGFDALVVGVLFVFFSHAWAGSVCVCVCVCLVVHAPLEALFFWIGFWWSAVAP